MGRRSFLEWSRWWWVFEMPKRSGHVAASKGGWWLVGGGIHGRLREKRRAGRRSPSAQRTRIVCLAWTGKETLLNPQRSRRPMA